MKVGLIGMVVVLQISGIVIKRGTTDIQPLPNARVELLDGPTHEVVRTDGAGRFVFVSILSGSYRVRVTRDGYVRQEYGQRLPGAPSFPIDVSGRSTKALAFLMQSAPTITGWVRDEYGSIVPGVRVEALRKTWDARGRQRLTLVSSTSSDDRGQYRLYWLDPGDYLVRASSGSGSGTYVPTYYPGFEDATFAETISLKDGEADGVDFKVVRGHRSEIDGTVVLAQGGFTGASVTITPSGDVASGNRYTAEASAQSGRTQGTFTISDVPPGTYVAIATRTIVGENYSGYITFNLPSGTVPIYHLRIVMSPHVEVSGTLAADSAEVDFSRIQVTLTAADPVIPSPPAVRVTRAGTFTVPSVAIGEYVISLSGISEDVYVKNAADAIVVGSESPTRPLKIVLGAQGGTATGVVRDHRGQPQFGAQVVLIPQGSGRPPSNQYYIVPTGPDGSFSVRGIAPGVYKVFAWEAVELNAYFDPEFVRKYDAFAVQITVAPGQKVALNPPMIPADH